MAWNNEHQSGLVENLPLHWSLRAMLDEQSPPIRPLGWYELLHLDVLVPWWKRLVWYLDWMYTLKRNFGVRWKKAALFFSRIYRRNRIDLVLVLILVENIPTNPTRMMCIFIFRAKLLLPKILRKIMRLWTQNANTLWPLTERKISGVRIKKWHAESTYYFLGRHISTETQHRQIRWESLQASPSTNKKPCGYAKTGQNDPNGHAKCVAWKQTSLYSRVSSKSRVASCDWCERRKRSRNQEHSRSLHTSAVFHSY